mgnify:FL=1
MRRHKHRVPFTPELANHGMTGAAVLWLAVAWLTNGQALVGEFKTLQDCRVAVAYARLQTYVLHATECQRVALEPVGVGP